MSRIGNNIRALRTLYGETLKETADAILTAGPSTISNYENDTSTPSPEILEMLAKHFRVTTYDLTNEDIMANKKIVIPSSKEEVSRNFIITFPIISSEKALKNDNFRKGFEYNKLIYKRICDQEEKWDESEIDKMITFYEKAIDQDIYEALANFISFSILCTSIEKNEQMLYGAQRFLKNKISQKEFIKDYLLYDYELDNIKKKQLDGETLENIESYLVLLKGKKETYEIADYYCALRYIMDIVNNLKTKEENGNIGYEMLWDLVRLNNKYARNFIKKTVEYARKVQ